MINSDVLSLIMSRLGNRKSTSLRETALLELQLKVQELEKAEPLPWFLETWWTSGNVLVPGQKWLDLPADWLTGVEESEFLLTDPTDGAKYKVSKRTPANVELRTANADPGIPKFYYQINGTIFFGPIPDKAYTITVPYCRKSVTFFDNSTAVSDWLKEATNAMIFSALTTIAYDVLQDNDMGQKYAGQANAAWASFKDYADSRRYQNLEMTGESLE